MATITVVGLGPGAADDLTLGVVRALQDGRPVLLRTERHPVARALREMGISFRSCDDLYDTGETFAQVYEAVVRRLLAQARPHGLVFAVPGHPLVGEETVRLLLERAPAEGVQVELLPAPSFLDTLFVRLRLDPVGGLEVVDAYRLEERLPSGALPLVVMQVHDRTVASRVKLALMERYPDEHPVTLVRAASVQGEERVQSMRLFEIDRHEWVDYLTSLYLPPLPPPQDGQADPRRWSDPRWPLDPLVRVMARLRGPGGCPWDREQTHRSLVPYLLEEAYETLEAVESGDPAVLKEELGDLLLQVAFHAQIASEAEQFTMHDIVEEITAKLVRRHPHVFGDVHAPTAADVTRNWEAIKRQEKGGSEADSLMDGIDAGMPALSRAATVQKKAARVGFDWEDERGPADKVREELSEVLAAPVGEREEEVGDLLFACVNLARTLKVDPETALARTTVKFMRRFRFIEREAQKEGRKLAEMSLTEMDLLWERAKSEEFGKKTD
jgi:tetrapyrrole methylase family protein / MazG family protein